MGWTNDLEQGGQDDQIYLVQGGRIRIRILTVIFVVLVFVFEDHCDRFVPGLYVAKSL